MSHSHRTVRRPGRLVMERLEDRENPNGTVTASLSAGGVLSITGDALDNDIRLQMTATGAIITGLNGTQIKVNGNVGASGTITGDIKHIHARLLAGNDTVAIDAALPFALSGNATFDLGAGNNRLDLATAAALNIGGNLAVRAAAGADTINVSGGLAAGSTVTGNASILLGTGGSSVNIQNLTINGGAGLRVAAGAGVDDVTLDGVVATRGGVSVAGGLDQLNVDLTGAINVAGNVGVSGAAGVDVDVAGGTFGGLTVRGGGFGAVTNVNIAGATTVNNSLSVRGSNTTLDIDAALSVGKHAKVAGGDVTFDASGSSLSIGQNLSISAGRTADVDFSTSGSADIGGNLRILGGIDGDSIDANGNLSVDGNLALFLRGGNNHVSLGTSGDLDVNGNLVILAGAGNDDVTLTQVKIDGNTVISLGAGTDSLVVRDGTTFTGVTVIDLGAGTDLLAVANNASATAGVTFGGQAVLSTGLDNDTIFLGLAQSAGGTAATSVTFQSAGNILNGGFGVDLFTQANAQIFGTIGIFGIP